MDAVNDNESMLCTSQGYMKITVHDTWQEHVGSVTFLSEALPSPPTHPIRLLRVNVPRSTSKASRLSLLQGILMTGALSSTSNSSRKPMPLAALSFFAVLPFEAACSYPKQHQYQQIHIKPHCQLQRPAQEDVCKCSPWGLQCCWLP